MRLGDLPELRAKVEEFQRVAAELDDMVRVYRTHAVCPLDELAVQNIILARHTADNIVKEI